MISTPLQPLLNIDSGKQRFPDSGSSTIPGFIELAPNSFGRTWIIQILIQLSRNFGGSSQVLYFHNARRYLSVSLEDRPELLQLLEVFPFFLTSVMIFDMVAIEKTSSSAALVTEALFKLS